MTLEEYAAYLEIEAFYNRFVHCGFMGCQTCKAYDRGKSLGVGPFAGLRLSDIKRVRLEPMSSDMIINCDLGAGGILYNRHTVRKHILPTERLLDPR